MMHDPGFNTEYFMNEDNRISYQKAWKHCKNQSKSIEVIYNDGDQKVLAKVHFRTDPLVSNN